MAGIAIIGLGNPGVRYQNTRHNCGFWLIDELALQKGVAFQKKTNFRAETASFSHNDKTCLLIKPMTYMNESGKFLQKLLFDVNCFSDSSILIHDDVAISLGELKISKTKSAGGHNGVMSVIGAIGSSIIRLRIGIGGKPRCFQTMSEFVLSTFSPPERALLAERKAHFLSALLKIVDEGVDCAMNHYNQSLKRKPLQ